MDIINVTKDNFEQEVLQADRPVLIDFWAIWCGPCKMLSPVIEKVALERDDIKVCKVNVDEEPELSIQFKVMSIPMLVVMKNGEVAAKSIGYVEKDEVLALIDQA